MKRFMFTLALVVVASMALAIPAYASFEVEDVDLRFLNQDGSPAVQAGAHPFEVVTSLHIPDKEGSVPGSSLVNGELKRLVAELPPGLVGSPLATPKCSTAKFVALPDSGKETDRNACPDSTAVGIIRSDVLGGFHSSVYNLVPPPGAAAKLGFVILRSPVVLELGLNQVPPYNIRAEMANVPQPLQVRGGELTLWGNPGDPAHDGLRGNCSNSAGESIGICHTDAPIRPLLTLPRACRGPLAMHYEAFSWEEPEGPPSSGLVITHDEANPPNPQGFTGCGRLGFSPRIESEATTDQAETGSGLNFSIEFNDEGISSPSGLAQSEIEKAEVTLPPGVTINPSIGEGLGVCTPTQIDRETVGSNPGEGCPNSSKIGTLHIETPLIDEPIDGTVFLAEQDDPTTAQPGAENPFDSLIALYLVLKNPNLGALVKIPLKLEPDPQTGRLVAIVENGPQIPFSRFEFHFKQGARAALVTPSTCGTYTTKAVFTPWANPGEPLTTTSSFQITRGVGGGPCPPAGVPPFHPQFEAGAINNNAGSFSPFNMRLIREDGEQDMTKFSAVLPPGELGSLAGVSKCPDSAIGIARSKTGQQELASPSCPANSLIGHTLAGAGVGSALTYVKGQVYLGGPFHGDPLSVISVTPAVAGPFDAGTVVVQLALNLNPKTAEVEVDGANSEPIPHILKGIVLKIRDLRVYVDRPNFTLNPTSCDESSAKSVLFGSYLDVLSPSDDKPIDLATRYQAANCLNLGFKPGLKLNLKGGTRRGGHPALKAIYTPKKGDANIKGLVVRLPRSAFLDQAHIKTICTRVQFAAQQCPARAQYGYIKAFTPLLDTPLEGPVYLRSSNHKLPDLVFDLHGLVDIEVAVRIDSAKGGIRATLENAPDAPLSKVDLRMQGAKKGLIINSRNLCGSTNRANVEFTGQNGKQFKANPEMNPECGGGRKHKRGRGETKPRPRRFSRGACAGCGRRP